MHLPEPRLVVDNLHLLAVEQTLAHRVRHLVVHKPVAEVDEDHVVADAVLACPLDKVNLLNKAHAELAEDRENALVADVGEDARDADAGRAERNAVLIKTRVLCGLGGVGKVTGSHCCVAGVKNLKFVAGGYGRNAVDCVVVGYGKLMPL